MGRITIKDIEQEKANKEMDNLCDGTHKLDKEFLERRCGKDVARLLSMIPECERKWVLDGNLGDYYFPCGIYSPKNSSIALSCDEIRISLPEGYDPETGEEGLEEFFEEDAVGCITVSGHRGYYYTGYGLIIEVNIDGLRETVMDKLREYLISSGYGIYIPQMFFEQEDFEKWGLAKEEFQELADPEHEHYWEAWEELLHNAEYIDKNGVRWFLEHDEDLWATPDLDAGYVGYEED